MGVTSRLLFGTVKTSTRRTLRIERPHVLLACMPKSASSFLSDAVGGLKGMRRGSLAWGYGWREQVLDVVQLARIDLRSYCAQLHLRYSVDVGELIREFKLTPVVLTRNIFDAAVSFRDHIHSLSSTDTFILAPFDPSHYQLSDEALDDMIADLVMPWYINFFVSWNGIDCLRVTYEQVKDDPHDVVRRICERADIPHDERSIAEAVKSARVAGNRFNKRVSGRGQSLSPFARERIASFARHYPDVDFSEIGIS